MCIATFVVCYIVMLWRWVLGVILKKWLNIFPDRSICLVSIVCQLELRFLMPTPNARKEETVTQQILWDFFKSMMIPCVRKRRRKTHQVCVPVLLPLPISRVCRYNYGISGRRFPDFFPMEKKALIFAGSDRRRRRSHDQGNFHRYKTALLAPDARIF